MLLDVKEEKQHIAFVESVNCFKTEQLRKTETVEKVVLPNAEGNPSHESNEWKNGHRLTLYRRRGYSLTFDYHQLATH